MSFLLQKKDYILNDEKELVLVVGSRNPTKVEAVRTVIERAVGAELVPTFDQVEVQAVEVASGVAAQPVGDEETLRGALSRAKRALETNPKATWGVGIEGGILQLDAGVFTTAWCAIVDRIGNQSVGGGLLMPLPPAIVRDLEAGYELGDATDRLFGVKHSKQAGGALGHLSKDLSNRQHAYEEIFTFALVKFLNPVLYELKEAV